LTATWARPIVILMSSRYHDERSNRALPVLGRAFVNTLIAYASLALVTFVLILMKEFVEPSQVNPYLGQAAGRTFFGTAVMAVASPIVFAGALCLDIALRRFAHPRRVVAVLALVPPAFFLLLAPSHGVLAGIYAAATLAIGLLTARIMRLPRRSVEPPEPGNLEERTAV
jgi:hypothetical protein